VWAAAVLIALVVVAATIRMRRVPMNSLDRTRLEYAPEDPVNALLTGPDYRLVLAQPEYEIFVRRRPHEARAALPGSASTIDRPHQNL
jgi:hypothetical protein